MPDEGLELPSVVCEVAQRTRMLAHTGRRCPPPGHAFGCPHSSGCSSTAPGSTPSPPTVRVRPWSSNPPPHTDLAPLIVQANRANAARTGEHRSAAARPVDCRDRPWLSPYTVRNTPTIFVKLGVRSRPELTALLIHDHCTAPPREATTDVLVERPAVSRVPRHRRSTRCPQRLLTGDVTAPVRAALYRTRMLGFLLPRHKMTPQSL